jgi:hypothetical protein
VRRRRDRSDHQYTQRGWVRTRPSRCPVCHPCTDKPPVSAYLKPRTGARGGFPIAPAPYSESSGALATKASRVAARAGGTTRSGLATKSSWVAGRARGQHALDWVPTQVVQPSGQKISELQEPSAKIFWLSGPGGALAADPSEQHVAGAADPLNLTGSPKLGPSRGLGFRSSD